MVHFRDLFIGEAGDVQLEGPEDVPDQCHGHLSDVRLLLSPDEIVERGHDRLMLEIAIITGEINEEHPALVASSHHVIVMQILLEVLPVKADAFALLARAVGIGQVFLDRRSDHLVAEEVIDCFVSHDVTGDVPAVAPFIDRELLAGSWSVRAVHELVLEFCSLEQLGHLIQLGLVLEAAAGHCLGACIVDPVCIIQFVIHKNKPRNSDSDRNRPRRGWHLSA